MKFCASLMSLISKVSMNSPVTTPTEIGTSCRFVALFVAVTTTSSSTSAACSVEDASTNIEMVKLLAILNRIKTPI